MGTPEKASSVSYDELLQKLCTSGSITMGWDIVCCYDLQTINDDLAKQHGKAGSKAVTTFQKTYKHDDGFGDKFNYAYDVSFGAPSIVFNPGTDTNCTIQFPITSGTLTVTKKGSEGKKVHNVTSNKYSIIAVVPLGYVYGEGKTQSAGNPFVFPAEGTTAANVALHLPMVLQSEVDITPQHQNSNNEEDKTFFRFFTDDFVDYLKNQAEDIEIILAGVTNEIPSSTSDIVVKPKKFTFSTSGNTKGSLNLFIQTINSGRDPGVNAPKLVIDNSDLLPIPTGNSASLYFSPAFLQQGFFKPALEKQKFDHVTSNPDVKLGSSFSAKWHENLAYTPGESFLSGWTGGHITFKTGHLNFEDAPFVFTFNQSGNQSGQLQVTLNLDGDIDWDWAVLKRVSAGGRKYNHTEGQAKAMIELDKSQKISDISELTQSNISLTFDIQSSDFATTIIPGTDKDNCWNDHLSSHISGDIQSKLKDTLPDVHFDLSGLYFFSITNLLFPGQKIINFDTQKGLAFPTDCFITGDMVPLKS